MPYVPGLAPLSSQGKWLYLPPWINDAHRVVEGRKECPNGSYTSKCFHRARTDKWDQWRGGVQGSSYGGDLSVHQHPHERSQTGV